MWNTLFVKKKGKKNKSFEWFTFFKKFKNLVVFKVAHVYSNQLLLYNFLKFWNLPLAHRIWKLKMHIFGISEVFAIRKTTKSLVGQLNVIKKPVCFRTTNFILLFDLCWTSIFRKYLYNKLNDRKKIINKIFSLFPHKQINFFIFLL
jgi:hypothetical protein